MNPAVWLLITALAGTPMPAIIETFVDQPGVEATTTEPEVKPVLAKDACDVRLRQIRRVGVGAATRSFKCVSKEDYDVYYKVARQELFEQYLKDEGLD